MVSLIKKTVFIRCKNCGRILIPDKSNRDGYCSSDCRIVYTRCTTCGRFFILQNEKNKENGTEKADANKKEHKKVTCSEECKVIYILHKK